MRSDITPGGTFPDYALPDHTNTVRKLSEIQGDDPLVVTLARGNYCPKEHQQHLEIAANYSKVAVAYTQIVTISTDDHHTTQEFRASVGAQWPFLSDPARTIQRDLDIQEYTDPEHDPMIPHTLVLKPGLVIHSVERAPPRLGPEHTGPAGAMGCGRLLQVSRMEQAGQSVHAVVV
jgi:peroxiredoxin